MSKTRSAIGQYLFHDLAAAHRKLHVGLNEKLKVLGVQVETWRVLKMLSSESPVSGQGRRGGFVPPTRRPKAPPAHRISEPLAEIADQSLTAEKFMEYILTLPSNRLTKQGHLSSR